jgi:4-diphosphocytidyl-2-C-methyl-D-erythritol kinase
MDAVAPAKLNLFLAVTGRRPDGFHDLVSLVATTAGWGDGVSYVPGGASRGLDCDDPTVPTGEANLVMKAAAAFEREVGIPVYGRFHLSKRVPHGAGLGGASSDAATALKVMNTLRGNPLAPSALRELAAGIGSDCALFFADGPCVMRGRGEALAALPALVRSRISGRRVAIFKPAFSVSTPWAYARLAAEAPESYVSPASAEERLGRWLSSAAPLEELLFNSMERAAFSKYPALPVLLQQIEARLGLRPRMSGSGSACFCLLPDKYDCAPLRQMVEAAWGRTAFFTEARLA